MPWKDGTASGWKTLPRPMRLRLSIVKSGFSDVTSISGLSEPFYGSSPPNSIVSFTQHEYEAAITKRMPRLIFVTTEDFRLPANLREPDIKSEAQLRFRER